MSRIGHLFLFKLIAINKCMSYNFTKYTVKHTFTKLNESENNLTILHIFVINRQHFSYLICLNKVFVKKTYKLYDMYHNL